MLASAHVVASLLPLPARRRVAPGPRSPARASLAEPASAQGSPTPRADPASRARTLALIVALVLAGASRAQAPGATAARALLRGGVTYVEARPLALALGEILGADGDSLTWRAAAGVLTAFAGSPDALFQPHGAARPEEIGFSAPVLRMGPDWYLPEDALETLGLRVESGAVALPGGRSVSLALTPPAVVGDAGASEVDVLANGVPAVRLYARAEDGGDGPSMMLVDVGLLDLVVPERRAELQAALDAAGDDKPLLVVVSSLRPLPFEADVRFEQDGAAVDARAPYRLRLLQGDPGNVARDRPMTAVALLPPSFSLYRPITIRWQGVEAIVTFRR